jgi:hypothetical protein
MSPVKENEMEEKLSKQPRADAEQMRAEFWEWVDEQGCDTDGAWSAWQAAWDRRVPMTVHAAQVIQSAVIAERERCALIADCQVAPLRATSSEAHTAAHATAANIAAAIRQSNEAEQRLPSLHSANAQCATTLGQMQSTFERGEIVDTGMIDGEEK